MNTSTRFLTLSEAARIAHVDSSTLRHAIALERLSAVKYGKMWLTDQEALDDWLRADVHKCGAKAKGLIIATDYSHPT